MKILSNINKIYKFGNKKIHYKQNLFKYLKLIINK